MKTLISCSQLPPSMSTWSEAEVIDQKFSAMTGLDSGLVTEHCRKAILLILNSGKCNLKNYSNILPWL